MKVSPVSADLLIKLAIVGVGVLAAVYVVRSITGAVGSIGDGFSRLWNGSPDGASDYADAVTAARADTDMNPFTNNPNNVNPVDLVPAGYTVNQWGGLVPVNTGGATGYW